MELKFLKFFYWECLKVFVILKVIEIDDRFIGFFICVIFWLLMKYLLIKNVKFICFIDERFIGGVKIRCFFVCFLYINGKWRKCVVLDKIYIIY